MKQHQTNSFISRAAAMLLTVIIAFAGAQTARATTETLGGYTFTIESDGEGQYYKVDCEAALRAIATYVNANAANTCSGKRFKQTKDIALTQQQQFTPIGTYANKTEYVFSGTYDGGGFTLTGLTVSGAARQALFGYVQNATIKNLTISGASITATSSWSGVFVGYSMYALTMVNCHAVNCTVNGKGSVGLLAGYMNGKGSSSYLKGCTATGGSVSGTLTSVGALVGQAYNTASNRMEMVGCVGRGVTGGSALVGLNNNYIQIIHSYDNDAYTITAGEGVTITYGAVSSDYPDVTQPPYIASGETVSLTLSHTSGSDAEFAATNALLNDTFTELSNATGNVTITATVRTDISGGTVTDIPTQTWTGSALTPAVTVTVGGRVLTEGTDYFVTYTNNSDIGINTATATVTGKGSYKGTLSKNFSIALSGVPYNATDGCYEIANETALRNLATYVNAKNTCSGKTFKQTQPITLTGGNFTPIGRSAIFGGTYDGGGLAISGLTVSIAGEAAGLFDNVKYGTVRNVLLVSPNVTSTVNSTHAIHVGALAGYCDYATIENCHVLSPNVSANGTGSGAKRLGALIGEILEGSVTNCHFNGGNQSNAIGYKDNMVTVTNVGQMYKLTLPTGVTATGTPVLTYAGKGYYTSGSSVTLSDLPAAEAGYLDWQYTVGGVAIDGTSFTIGEADATVALTHQPDPDDFSVSGSEYTIHTAAGWGVFCDALQDNDTYNRFSGKTVKLAADITVSRMAGSDSHDFCGTFDGDGHTLTFNYGTDGSYASDEYAAPFHYVSNVGSEPATIKNLHVAGHIYTSAKYAAGLIAQHWGTVNVENCRVSTVIHSSVNGDGTHGGFEAECKGVLNITGCVFDGKLLTTNGTDNCGGFVGWHYGGTTNISNSLYAPAAIATGEREAGPGTAGQNPSATFGRNAVNSIANSYYTRTLGTAQGKQARTIKAGENVTLGHDGAATEYSVSGITAYKSGDDFTSGILYDNVLYAGSGDEVSLTLTNSATPAAEAPAGYQYSGDYSATGGATLSGSTLTMADDNVTVSFTLSDQLRSTGQAVSVSYIDAEGILCDGQDGRPDPASAIALDGTESSLGTINAERWYFVGADISHSGMINCYSNVNIILCDGKTMTVSGGSNGISSNSSNPTLTIYGQALDTGTLDVTGTDDGIYHYYGNVVIRGGTVNATGTTGAGISAGGYITITGGKVNATGYFGIDAYRNVTITGGQVTATGTEEVIYSNNGNITLGWTSASDFITASSYGLGNSSRTVSIASGQSLYNGSEVLGSGTVADYASKLDGKTLIPYIESTFAGTAILYDNDAGLPDGHRNADRITDLAADGTAHDIMLMGRTLYKDGAWNTLCLPFALGDDQAPSGHELDGTPLEGATLMTLGNSQACNTGFDPQTGTLNLDFLPATTVEPGVAYIVKWPIPDGMTADEFAAAYAANPDAYDLKNPVFTGVTVTNDAPADHATTSLDGYVTFIGTYGPAPIYADPAVNLYLGAANKLYWPSTEGYRLGAFRAYFALGNGLTCGDPSNPNAARAITLNFGDASEETGIREIVTDPTPGPSPAWEGSAAGWYTLDGVRLNGKPTKKGLYIHNGNKVAVP